MVWLNVIFRSVVTRTPIAPQPRQPIHYHHVGVALVGNRVGARHVGHPRAIERELGVGHDAQPGQVAELKGPRSGLRPQGREGQRQGGQWYKRCFHNPKLGKVPASDGISRCAKPRPARGLPSIRCNAPSAQGRAAHAGSNGRSGWHVSGCRSAALRNRISTGHGKGLTGPRGGPYAGAPAARSSGWGPA